VSSQQRTEHQENWWGIQPCRNCNSGGFGTPTSRPKDLRPQCIGCDGSGWTVWAALANEAWSEIIPGLWVGGHDYVPYPTRQGEGALETAYPGGQFDVVVSAYQRDGCAPDFGVEHHEVIFPDAQLDSDTERTARELASVAAQRVREGHKVLVRCQAGLNRSSLIAGIALVNLGYEGRDAVQLIRSKRSPWALCNEDYADYIRSLNTQQVVR
jgi:hypothetical protein